MIAGTTALPVMSDTGMTATGKTVHPTVGTVPDRLPAGPSTMIVAPGLRPLGGRLMIEGLQGTMITGEEVMMIAEGLIIMLTDAGTIEDATRKKTASTKGLQGMRMEMVVGLVELFVVLGFRTQARREKKEGVYYDFSGAMLVLVPESGVVYAIGVLSCQCSVGPMRFLRPQLALSFSEVWTAHFEGARMRLAHVMSQARVKMTWTRADPVVLADLIQWMITGSIVIFRGS